MQAMSRGVTHEGGGDDEESERKHAHLNQSQYDVRAIRHDDHVYLSNAYLTRAEPRHLGRQSHAHELCLLVTQSPLPESLRGFKRQQDRYSGA
jgi:hypothetical protein